MSELTVDSVVRLLLMFDNIIYYSTQQATFRHSSVSWMDFFLNFNSYNPSVPYKRHLKTI